MDLAGAYRPDYGSLLATVSIDSSNIAAQVAL